VYQSFFVILGLSLLGTSAISPKDLQTSIVSENDASKKPTKKPMPTFYAQQKQKSPENSRILNCQINGMYF